MTDAAGDLGLRPLTARSVLLSVLLGTHPPRLPVKALVGTAGVFGVSEGTARVALSRLAADGDVIAGGAGYELAERLVRRQRRQDEGFRPATRPWRGGWEVAVAPAGANGSAALAALGAELAALRLAELRPGIWARPDNLHREWPEDLASRVLRFASRPAFDDPPGPALAASLWDLAAWSDQARRLKSAMESNPEPATRFSVAAAIVRHLRDDPVLPRALLPQRWPGRSLREVYARYEAELAEVLRQERERHGAQG